MHCLVGKFDSLFLGCILGKFFLKTIVTSAAFSLIFHCLGCSTGTQAASTQGSTTPSITQVLPQTIPAGSPSTTLKVSGTNFPSQAAILWNGAPVATTVVDANTLSGTVGPSSLATPATVQLQVQNTQTMVSSQAVPLVIAAPNTTTPSALSISTTTIPQGVVGTAYTATLAATGGTTPYTWSISKGTASRRAEPGREQRSHLGHADHDGQLLFHRYCGRFQLDGTVGKHWLHHVGGCSADDYVNFSDQHVVASFWDDWYSVFGTAAGERRHGALHLVLCLGQYPGWAQP